MIDTLEDGKVKLLEIGPDKVKEKIEEIEQVVNATMMQHPVSKKYIIVDKRFKKRLEEESWKEIKKI